MTETSRFYEPSRREHPTQTLVFNKTAGRQNLVGVIVILSLPVDGASIILVPRARRFLVTWSLPIKLSGSGDENGP